MPNVSNCVVLEEIANNSLNLTTNFATERRLQIFTISRQITRVCSKVSRKEFPENNTKICLNEFSEMNCFSSDFLKGIPQRICLK